MKEINELDVPDDLYYTEDHEWVRVKGENVTIGVSDYAQDQLGDIVFVEMPASGDQFKKGDEFGTVESVKAVAELYMPIGGKVIRVNQALEDAPELLNQSPYAEGWIIEIKPEDASQLEAILNKEAYLKMLEGLE
ncbi:MAG: glycine cleavage system protein GcvH [Deltaproteobacteria bacterium]|jgi:glycine cleavage system H protein|nr:glycine cleavage system protein GcvH [Deltaproteobacteria bacterium]